MRQLVCKILGATAAAVVLLAGCVAPAWANQQEPLAEEHRACVFSDPSLAAVCNSERDAQSLLPLELEAIVEAYVSVRVKRANPTLDDVRWTLASTVPEVSTVSALLEARIPAANAPDRKLLNAEIGRALLCPMLLREEVKEPCGPVAVSPLSYRELIVGAMRAQAGEDCATAKDSCWFLSSRATAAVVDLSMWWPILQARFDANPECKAAKPQECLRAIYADVFDLASTWLGLRSMYAPAQQSSPCLDQALGLAIGKTQVNALRSVWEQGQDAAKTNSPLLDPAQAARLIAVRAAARSIREWLNGPEAFRLEKACRQAEIAIPEVEAVIAKGKTQVIDVQPEGTVAPLRCNSRLDVRLGYHDFCASGTGAFAGLRVVFGSIASASGCNRNASGQILLLIRTSKELGGTPRQLIALESGVVNMRLLHLCDAVPSLRLPQAPIVGWRLDSARLASAIAGLVPKPFVVSLRGVNVAQAKDDTRISLNVDVDVSVEGLTGPEHVQLALGPDAKVFESDSMLARLQASLETAIKSRLAGLRLEEMGILRRPGCFKDAKSADLDGHALRIFACIPNPLGKGTSLESLPLVISLSAKGETTVRVATESMDLKQLATALEARLSGLSFTDGWDIRVGEITSLPGRVRAQVNLTAPFGNPRFVLNPSLDFPLSAEELESSLREQWTNLVGSAASTAKELAAREALRAFVEEVNRISADWPALAPRVVKINVGPPATVSMEATLPGESTPISFDVVVGQAVPKDALIDALVKRIDKKVGGKNYSPISGFEFIVDGVKKRTAEDGKAEIVVDGNLVLSESPRIAVGVHLPLTLPLKPILDDPDKAALDSIAGLLSSELVSLAGGDKAGKPTITWERLTPTLNWPISLSVPLGAAELTGTTTIRVSPKIGLRLGVLSLGCEGSVCWLPVGPGLMIGNPSGTLDLEHPQSFSVGATLALSPGDGMDKIARLDVTVLVEPTRLSLIGDVFLLDQAAGRTKGVIDFKEGSLRVDAGLKVPLLNVPLPSAQMVIDGKRCIFAGKFYGKLLGITSMNLSSGLVLREGQCDPSLATTDEALLLVLRECGTGTASTADLAVCGSGDAELLQTKVSARFAASLIPLRLPTVEGRLEIIGFDIAATVAPVYLKLDADLKGVLSVTLVLPGLAGLTRDDVQRILEQLLRPTINLDALLNALKERKIVVSTFPDSGKQQGPEIPGAPGAKEAAQANEADGAEPPKESPNAGAPPPQGPRDVNRGAASGVQTLLGGSIPVTAACTNNAEGALAVGDERFRLSHDDACRLAGKASPRLRILNFASLGWIPLRKAAPLNQPWIPACEADHCDSAHLWLIPVATVDSDEQAMPAKPISLAAFEDIYKSDFPGTRRLNLPSLFRNLMLASYAGAQLPTSHECLARAGDGSCSAAITWESAGMEYHKWSSEPVQNDSLLGMLVSLMNAPVGQFPSAAKPIAADWIGGDFEIMGLIPADGEGAIFALIRRRSAEHRVTELRRVSASGETQIAASLLDFPPFFGSFGPAGSRSRSVAGSALATVLAAQYRSRGSKPLHCRRGRADQISFKNTAFLCSLTENDPDPVVVATSRSAGSACGRTARWSDVMTTLRTWRDHDVLGEKVLTQMPTESKKLQDFVLLSLEKAVLDEDGFRMNPLLLLGDMKQSCARLP